MSRTAVIVSDAEDNRALCRLCMIYHEYYVNIFIPNDTFRICAEEAIHDLLRLKVAVGDGLPSNICHQCAKKLMEFRDFKEMCLKTAEELGKYDLDNVLGNDAKEELWSTENALVVKEEVNDGQHCIEGDVPVSALTSVAVDPLAVDAMALKEEAQEPKRTAGDRNSLGDISPHSHIQVTEVFVPVPDQLSMEMATHVEEDWRPAELMVNEEIGDGVDCIENGVPAVSLSSVSVDPLAVDTTALKAEAQEPNGDAGKGNSLGDKCPYNHIRVTEVFVPVPDKLAMGTVCHVEKDLRPTALMYKEEIGDGLDCSENDIPVGSLSSVNVDPLAVDTASSVKDDCMPMQLLGEVASKKCNTSLHYEFRVTAVTNNLSLDLFALENQVDHQNNIGDMTKEPEKESDKCDADRKRTSQNKELNNFSSSPTHEENSQLKYPKPNSFAVDCFSQFSQLNDSARPVRDYECEQLGHQAENTSYPTEYICNYCNTRYSEIYSLALHIKMHVDGKRSASVLPNKKFSPIFSQNLLVKEFKCIECGKTFSRSSDLNRHSVVHNDVKRFKCNECGKMFAQSGTLKSHLLVHTGVKQFNCNECGKVFTRKDTLKTHTLIHTNVKRFKCNECGKMFTRKDNLKTHSLIHTDVKRFKCNECGKMFTRKCHLEMHSLIHTHVKRFKCNECGKMFTQSGTLKSHLLVHTGVKQFKCNECGRVFTGKDTLKTHTLYHTDVKRFKCNDCGMMFTQSGTLKRYSLIHTGVKQFKCNECGKMFTRKCHLEMHSVIHTDVKRFKCNECGKMFTQSGNLKSHLLVHTGVKQFKCNECGKVFTRKDTLKTHTLIHTRVKQFKCNECGKMFTRKCHLEMHSVIHTDVKRFKCNECGKMFTRKDNLKTHSLIHTDVKRFKCNECGKVFTRKDNLKTHSLIHTDVKRFKCNECGKMFTQSGNLKSHLLVHTGVKQFKCNECGKVFTKISDLKSHSVIHTGVKPIQMQLLW